MAKVITDNKHYTAIADALRSNSFGEIEGPMSPHEFAQRIEEISAIGQEQGRIAGYEQGVEAGKPEGIQSEYDRFWDAYQYNGTRTSYISGFAGNGWKAETFKPKYDMAVSNAYLMFSNFSYQTPISLKQILIDCGVSLTFPKCSNIGQMFEASGITEIGELDFSTVTRTNGTAIFNACALLESIDKIILPNGQTTFNNWFAGCTALKSVTFEGVIGANNLNVQKSTLLSHDSLMSIINCLADKSADTSGTTWAVTLGTTNLAKLTDAEKAIATQRGWTLA